MFVWVIKIFKKGDHGKTKNNTKTCFEFKEKVIFHLLKNHLNFCFHGKQQVTLK